MGFETVEKEAEGTVVLCFGQAGCGGQASVATPPEAIARELDIEGRNGECCLVLCPDFAQQLLLGNYRIR